MKTFLKLSKPAACFWVAAFACASIAAAPEERLPQPKNAHLSIRHETQRAIDRGLHWLEKNQSAEGYWSTGDSSALTSLALLAFKGDPSGRFATNEPAFIKQAFIYLEGCVQPDGSIYNKKEYLTHNTALGILALHAAKNPKYEPAIRKGRAFLVGLQSDFGERGKTDDVFDGGIGYGSKYEHSDLANTLSALEALYHTRKVTADKPDAEKTPELNFAAAIHFLQNCQNLEKFNKQAWVSEDAQNKGGFIYYPGHSMAGEAQLPSGKTALRSYGSASYAGLLSYIYADLKRDDPRVEAVYNWLKENYTLEENPGMGPQGFYYYLHTMAKALSAYGVSELETRDGQKIDWRKDLALRLINLQQPDGSWVNENGRWWEKDPALVTSYAVIALELIHRGL